MKPTNLTTVTKNTTETVGETCATIKLGIDAHAKWYHVARQLDGATTQPVRMMTFEGLLRMALV